LSATELEPPLNCCGLWSPSNVRRLSSQDRGVCLLIFGALMLNLFRKVGFNG
jgi:hypothetical protein